MKKLQIIIAIVGFLVFSIQSTYAQKETKSQEKVYKTTISKAPQKVKDVLKNYSGYVISNAATFTKKNNVTVYKIQLTKRNWSHFIYIDQTGKVKGIDTGEHSGSLSSL